MREALLRILRQVASGETSPEEALDRLSFFPYEDLGFVRLDHQRALRKHFPEVIYGAGKSLEELEAIVSRFLERNLPLLITMVSPRAARVLKEKFPVLEHFERGRLLGFRPERREGVGRILILSGGTSDLPVVEEARVVAEYLGNRVEVLCDVGGRGFTGCCWSSNAYGKPGS